MSALTPTPPARATAGINPQMSFQGRLLTASGAVVPDGAYNLEFKLYTGGTGCVAGGTSPCGGTNVWTEDWVYGTGAPDNRVILRNGYFSVQLGALSSLTGVDFNNDTLWTSINIGDTTTAATFGAASGDGEMLPFKRLTSSPYAFNAGNLGGIAASGFIQNVAPNVAQQTANINILSGAATNVAAMQVQTVASATAPVLIVKGGATPGAGADLLQLQNSASAVLFRVDSAGVIGSADVSAGATNSAGTTLRTGNSTTSGNTGDLTISTGTATSGNSGNITIGTGSATGTPGSVIVKNATNSATAFAVQNAAGTPVLNVGTTDSTITIRSSQDSAATLGTELVTDQNFAGAGWSTSDPTNWVLTGSDATYSGTYDDLISNQFASTPGDYYKYSYTVTGAPADYYVDVYVGNGYAGETQGNGTFTGYGQASNTDGVDIATIPNTTGSATISNVSVKHATFAANTAPVLVVKNANGSTNLEVRTSGDSSIAIGVNAGSTQLINSVALGANALQANTAGYDNVAIGPNALQANTTGYANTASGVNALQANTTGSYNTASGSWALQSNTTGNSNTASGKSALYRNTTGNNNTASGESALYRNTTGNNNTASGYSALWSNTTGSWNTASGNYALYSNTTGNYNTASGNYALQANTTGNYNTASGESALYYLKTLTGTISATATNAGKAKFTSTDTAGLVAGLAITISGTTSYNGARVVQSVDSGTTFTITAAFSTADAAGSWTTASTNSNTAVGYESGQGNYISYTATGNSLFGYQSGLVLQSGANYNSLFGYSAGSGITTGTQNVLLGYNAGTNLTTGSNNVLIGQGVVAPVATGSNQLQIGVGVSGDLSTGTLAIKTATNSATAFQVQNTAGNNIFSVDTSGNQIVLGKPGGSGITGQIQFANSTNANTATIVSGVTSTSYQLTLPTALSGGAGDCLKDTTGAGVLAFSACGAASGNLQGSYNASGGATPSIAVNTTNKAVTIQNSITSGIAAGNEYFGIRATGASDVVLGNSLFTVNSAGVGINIGGTGNPVTAADLSFGSGANRTINVITQTAGNTAGNNLSLTAATGNGTGAGGALALNGGAGGSGATGNGGATTVTGGNAASTNGSGGSVTISGGTKTGSGTGGSVIVKPQASNDSATAFQVQNATGNGLLTVDTSGSQTVLGKAGAGGIDGKLVFNNAAGANTVTLQAPGSNPASSFALILPTTAGNANECIKNTATPGTLTYGTCGGGTSSMQGAYDGSTTTNPQILLSSAYGGIKIQDGATPVTGNLLQIGPNGSTTTAYLGISATAFTLQDTAGNNALVFDSTTSHLKVYENIASPTRFADIYYDNATSTAIFAASSGTTQVGTGAGGGGNINLILTGTADQLLTSKTNTLAAAYGLNDFQFTRNLTGGAYAVTGNVMTVEDLTAFSGGSSAPNVLYVNQNNTSATGNLILAQTGGGANDKFKVTTAGNATLAGGVTVGSGSSYTGSGALTLQSGAGAALTVTANAASTWSTSTGALTVSSAGALTLSSATATTWSTTTGNLTIQAGGANTVILKPGTDSATALQVQNASGASMLDFDSSANQISIGVSDTTGTLLVLDTKTDATDPTGANGGMYYNSNAGRFRCYENGAWKNCVSAWTTINKTSDEVINSDATLSDDSILKFTTLPNTKYHIRLRVFQNAGSATADFKYRLAHTGTTTSVARRITWGAGNNVPAEQLVLAAFDAADVALTDTAAGQNVIFEDVILDVGASGGTLSFQWAQNTSTAAANTTVYAGSILEYDQL